MNNSYASPVGIVKKDIYIIKNDINTKVYIGQSLDSEQRFKSHCKGDYDNSLIDKAIQKYGKEHFWFEILESQIENYNEREKYWIKYYNSKVPFGYNTLGGGEEPPHYLGDDHPNTKISDDNVILLKKDLAETTISLSKLAEKYGISKKQVLRINQGISRATLGEKYPIRKNPNINGKLTEEDVDNIIELLKYTYRFNGDIAREFGVEVHTISKINNGTIHHRDNIQYPVRNWKSSGAILFTYEQVTEIINALSNTKESIQSIAKRYNVNRRAIENINRGTSKKYFREGLSYPLRKF
jgi:group I intron endonuclease